MPDNQLHLTAGQFSRFVVVGVISTAVNYLVFLLLLRGAGTPYLAASAVGFLSGMALGFRLNRSWTYRAGDTGSGHFLRYTAVYCLSLVAGLALLEVLTAGFGLPPEIGNLATICLTTATNFAGTKLWVFRA